MLNNLKNRHSKNGHGLKHQKWRAAVREVKRISERSETPIDPAIKQVVIGLRAFHLPTESSCGGHLRIWGAPYPWIQFVILKRQQGYTRLREQALHHQKVLQTLLDDFYQENPPKHFEAKLSIHFFKNNKWGVFYLQSIGAQFLENCPQSVQTRVVPCLRAEMCIFGHFLKDQITRS